MDLEKLMSAAQEIGADAGRAKEREVQERMAADAADAGYWRALCPDLHVEGPIDLGLDAEPQPDAVAGYRGEGYCPTEPVLPADLTDRLAAGVGSLREAGWPPLFALVYDELWALAWNRAAHGLAAAILGADPDLSVRVAVHYVHRAAHSRGWTPHADLIGEGRVSMWIPITDATLDNGCMYVVPQGPETQAPAARFDDGEVDKATAAVLLQHARALPAAAGSLLCWHEDTLHWGSVSRSAPTPRISAAFEWIVPGAPLDPGEPAPVRLDGPPPAFAERLASIADGIARYWHQDATLPPFLSLVPELRGG